MLILDSTTMLSLILYDVSLSSEFGFDGMKEEKLRRKIAKLNGNVIYLCLSQGIDPCQIKPKLTIQNLLLLLLPGHADLGR